MGTASFELNMTLNGTNEELMAMLGVFQKYVTGDESVYFLYPEISRDGEGEDFEEMDEQGMQELLEASQGDVEITADGPYGNYCELNDANLFREMAEVAPHAKLEANIIGNTTYTAQSLYASLGDGILHLRSTYEENGETDDAYIDYVKTCLPYQKFVELFQITDESFDEDTYGDFIYEVCMRGDCSFTDLSYNEWMEALECESDLEAEDFDAAMAVLKAMKIMSEEDFRWEHEDDLSNETEMTYDPVAKAYISKSVTYTDDDDEDEPHLRLGRRRNKDEQDD